MFDQPLSDCLDVALARVSAPRPEAPAAAAALHEWMARLSPTGRARDHFAGGRSVMLVLPWWLEKRIHPVPDPDFQQHLVDSSVNAYYFVRLIDNIMDGHGAEDRPLLPLTALLHADFMRPYARLFPPGAPFWDHFGRHWNATVEAAVREKTMTELSLHDFVHVAARKTSAIKIPLAAVCCHYDRLDLLEPWCGFHDRFACWQQMADDTFDWVRDLQHGNVTFFLSEGARQKSAGESISGWVVRRGFTWAVDWLADAMATLRSQAEQLGSPEVVRFLEYRAASIREHRLELGPLLKELTTVADAFEPLAD